MRASREKKREMQTREAELPTEFPIPFCASGVRAVDGDGDGDTPKS